MQYMISPMDLTERQLLIYKVLYDKCDFSTMEVSITIQNIVNAIKVADFSYDAVYRDVNRMIKKGYIRMVRKPAKGVAPIYKLVKIKELKSANQVQTKCKPSANQNQEISTDTGGIMQTKCKPSANQVLTNSNDNDKDNNIYSQIQEEFNYICINLPSVRKITDGRKKAINARIKEYDLETVLEVFKKVSKSKFLNGDSKQGWKASFDWIMKPSNFAKILEGNYDNKEKQKNKDVNFDDIPVFDDEGNIIT